VSRVQSTTEFPESPSQFVVGWPKPVPNSAGLAGFGVEGPAEFLSVCGGVSKGQGSERLAVAGGHVG